MGNQLSSRQRKLLYLSTRRGTKEADMIIGGFVKNNIKDFSEEELVFLEALLLESDPDLLYWISAPLSSPKKFQHRILTRLSEFQTFKTKN
ncbi:MAG: succinate dehydrogenase assembly factor 2 [Pseudomonadota bacterium]|nr:succinate dehydrogenase assembly factor 2 [Pseudomonadota bacterium]